MLLILSAFSELCSNFGGFKCPFGALKRNPQNSPRRSSGSKSGVSFGGGGAVCLFTLNAYSSLVPLLVPDSPPPVVLFPFAQS